MGLLNGVNVNLNFGEIARAIKKPGQDDIFTKAFKHNGSIMRLLKPYIIQPTFYVSKNVKRELSSIEHDVITEQVDIFASFIAQAFRVLIGSEKLSERAAVELMSSGGYDYDLMKVGSKFLKRGVNMALDKAIASIESRDVTDDVTMAFRANNFLTCSSESYTASMELMFVDDEHLENHIKNQVNDKFNALKNENPAIVNRMDTKKTNSRETEISGVRDLKDQEKDAIYGYQIRHFIIRINVDSSVTTPEYDPKMMGSKHGASSFIDKPNYTHTHTLSVAKVVEIPITIKANILFVEPEEIINAITYKGKESSFIRRWEEYRSGGIGLWDLIFAGDLVKNYRKNKFKDKQNIINKIASSEIHSLSKIPDYGVQGYDRFYNMYCFTAEDAKKLEFYAKSKLSNYGSRQKIMEALNAQQIMILDKEWENGTLYLESLSDSSVIPFKKIGKRGGKDKVNDILEALMANQAPRF